MRRMLIAALLALSTTAAAAPAIHVRIASVRDAGERAACVELVKRSLRSIEAKAIDVAITQLVVTAAGEVSAKVDIVLSGAGGMRSIISGAARFVAPRHQLRDQAALRREVLAHALEALHHKVRVAARPTS